MIVNQEQQVLGAKKVALQRQLQILTAAKPTPPIEKLTVNQREARTSNFRLFYEHKREESHLIPFMRKYRFVNIQYIRDIKKNKFKLGNIMKLSTSIRRIRKAVKSPRFGTSGLEIEAKEEEYTTTDVKSIIPLLRAFHV